MRPRIGVIGLSGDSILLRVRRFPSPGETIAAAGMETEPGGKGYNQAVACARLGAEVSFLSPVGADPAGDLCEDVARREGIAHPLFLRKAGAMTARAVVMSEETGENTVTVYPGASLLLTGEDVRAAEGLFRDCDILLLQLEMPLDILEAAFELAEKHGIRVILNPAPAKPVAERCLRRAALLTPNETEAKMLLGFSQEDEVSTETIAALFRERGLCPAVITLGGRGSMIVTDAETEMVPPEPVEAVDTTGAGDVFNAALAVRLAQGSPLRDAAYYAARASGWSVSRRGVLQSIPTREQLETLVRQEE